MTPAGTEHNPPRTRLQRVISGEKPPDPLEHHDSLVERYAEMSHAFQPRPVDHVLRLLDMALAGSALFITSPLSVLIAGTIKLTLSLPGMPARR